MSDYKPIVKLLQANAHSRHLRDVFTDFVEMSALSLRNAISKIDPVDTTRWQAREDEYLLIAGRYTRDQLDRFGEALGRVGELLTGEPRDVLGHLYMSLELGDKHQGQLFTPYDVARLMAEMQVDGLVEQLDTKPFVRVHEPACGAGALIVATCEALRAKGVNYQQRLHITAEDLSAVAVHMCFVHLALMHVPAVIHRRNTLTQETWDTWRTPAHVLGGWDWELRRTAADENAGALLTAEQPAHDIPVLAQASSWDDVFAGIGGAA